MKRNQPMIPGLEGLEKAKDKAKHKESVFLQRLQALENRMLVLELEVSRLKALLLKKAKSPEEQPDCYFYSDDRCLGRPADTCKWSVKVGDWEWVCAYPWKEKDGHS